MIYNIRFRARLNKIEENAMRGDFVPLLDFADYYEREKIPWTSRRRLLQILLTSIQTKEFLNLADDIDPHTQHRICRMINDLWRGPQEAEQVMHASFAIFNKLYESGLIENSDITRFAYRFYRITAPKVAAKKGIRCRSLIWFSCLFEFSNYTLDSVQMKLCAGLLAYIAGIEGDMSINFGDPRKSVFVSLMRDFEGNTKTLHRVFGRELAYIKNTHPRLRDIKSVALRALGEVYNHGSDLDLRFGGPIRHEDNYCVFLPEEIDGDIYVLDSSDARVLYCFLLSLPRGVEFVALRLHEIDVQCESEHWDSVAFSYDGEFFEKQVTYMRSVVEDDGLNENTVFFHVQDEHSEDEDGFSSFDFESDGPYWRTDYHV